MRLSCSLYFSGFWISYGFWLANSFLSFQNFDALRFILNILSWILKSSFSHMTIKLTPKYEFCSQLYYFFLLNVFLVLCLKFFIKKEKILEAIPGLQQNWEKGRDFPYTLGCSVWPPPLPTLLTRMIHYLPRMSYMDTP